MLAQPCWTLWYQATSTVVSHSAWAVGGGGSHHRVVRGEIVIGRKMSCFPTSIRPVLCDASGLTRLIKFLSSRNGRGAEIISISSVLLSRILASSSSSTRIPCYSVTVVHAVVTRVKVKYERVNFYAERQSNEINVHSSFETVITAYRSSSYPLL